MKRTVRRAAEMLDFPPDSLPGAFRLELYGSSEAVISPCRGILRYSPEEVTLKVSDGRMRIAGRGLVMRSCNDMTLRINGEIFSVTTAEGLNAGRTEG